MALNSADLVTHLTTQLAATSVRVPGPLDHLLHLAARGVVLPEATRAAIAGATLRRDAPPQAVTAGTTLLVLQPTLLAANSLVAAAADPVDGAVRAAAVAMLGAGGNTALPDTAQRRAVVAASARDSDARVRRAALCAYPQI